MKPAPKALTGLEVIGHCLSVADPKLSSEPTLFCGNMLADFFPKHYAYVFRKTTEQQYVYWLMRAKHMACLEVFWLGMQHESPIFHVCIVNHEHEDPEDLQRIHQGHEDLGYLQRVHQGRGKGLKESKIEKHLRLEGPEVFRLRNHTLIPYLLEKFLD